MPTYSQTKTVFVLSMLSNHGSNVTGDLEEIEQAIYKKLNHHLAESDLIAAIGTWKILWGPAIYQAPLSDIADNLMVVFQADADCAVPGQLVVAIAGTNSHSAFDAILEDVFVKETVAWAYASPPNLNPRISAGTFLGLGILQSLVPGDGLPGVGLTLPNFLKSILTAPTPITIAGHSLGGALSPALTLWLSDTKTQWDPSGFSSLACLPSAGPTPGDQDFSTYYDNQLESVTTRVYNSLDLVPHAWEADDLKEAPDLYNPPISATWELEALLDWALSITMTNDYTQICKSTLPLPGVFNTDHYDPTKSGCDNFLAQVLYQHVDAYFDLLGVKIHGLQAAVAGAAPAQRARLKKAVRRKLLVHKLSKSQ